jgi:type III pantothenate kinase
VHGRKEHFLVIDVGNTTVHFGVCNRERILTQFRISSIASRFRKEAARALRAIGAKHIAIEGALVSSVVPLLDSSVNSLCRRMGIIPIWLNYKTPTGITLRYKKPQEIGSDRIANVAAARALYSVPAIVVDIGTAITFDCVSESGAYLGGVIAPGPMLSRAALAERTGLLPFAEIETPPQLIGTSTVRAIQAGVIFGTRALISGIIRGLQKEMGCRPEIIFTGGQLELIIDGWDYAKLVDPLLTLQGLRIIYNKTVVSSQ